MTATATQEAKPLSEYLGKSEERTKALSIMDDRMAVKVAAKARLDKAKRYLVELEQGAYAKLEARLEAIKKEQEGATQTADEILKNEEDAHTELLERIHEALRTKCQQEEEETDCKIEEIRQQIAKLEQQIALYKERNRNRQRDLEAAAKEAVAEKLAAVQQALVIRNETIAAAEDVCRQKRLRAKHDADTRLNAARSNFGTAKSEYERAAEAYRKARHRVDKLIPPTDKEDQ